MKKKLTIVLVFALVLTLTSFGAMAEEGGTVKVGCIYPVTGNASPIGILSKNAVELITDIVNNSYDLDLPLAKTEGLPNLGGAKIEVVYGDSQAQAAIGQSEAERLINTEKVAAIIGCYNSAVAATIMPVCERAQVPFVVADCSSSGLTEYDYEYYFRTGPTDVTFNSIYFDFLEEMREKEDFHTIALVYENTESGLSSSAVQKKFAEEFGYEVVLEIPYSASATDVSSEVLQLKNADPDLIMHNSNVSDAILFTNTYKSMNYLPKMIFADAGGFTTAEYLNSVGTDGEYVIATDAWSLGLGENNDLIYKVNDIYKERYGADMDGNTARSFMGALTLYIAINDAASTDSTAIKDAIAKVELDAKEGITSWGIKFDPDTHENTLTNVVLNQIYQGNYEVVYPTDFAEIDVIFPMPGWSER